MQAEVRAAFQARPRLVETAPGFLGFEVFTPTDEPDVFLLLTRWSDRGAYERWHASDAHAASHAGIPPGLHLDPAHTRVEVLERIEEPVAASALEHATADAAPLLREGEGLVWIEADAQARVTRANPAACRVLGLLEPAGAALAAHLTEQDAAWLRQAQLDQARRVPRLLNFVTPEGVVSSVEALVDVRPDGVVLVGLGETTLSRRVREELLSVTGDLSVQLRAEASARVHLEELQRSHWLLRKLEEVLPVCMRCERVKTGDGSWGGVLEYLRANSSFLSHGYCPACAQQVRAEMRAALDRPGSTP